MPLHAVQRGEHWTGGRSFDSVPIALGLMEAGGTETIRCLRPSESYADLKPVDNGERFSVLDQEHVVAASERASGRVNDGLCVSFRVQCSCRTINVVVVHGFQLRPEGGVFAFKAADLILQVVDGCTEGRVNVVVVLLFGGECAHGDVW